VYHLHINLYDEKSYSGNAYCTYLLINGQSIILLGSIRLPVANQRMLNMGKCIFWLYKLLALTYRFFHILLVFLETKAQEGLLDLSFTMNKVFKQIA